jgi:ABC-type uncharacterized transport system ATPase subunit
LEPPALSLRDVSKTYANGTVALSGVTLDVAPGTIHAIVGENGAGKSTLMRIVARLETQTAGEVTRRVPSVGMVHQHFTLVPSFTAAEAVALGDEPRGFGLLDRRAAARRLSELSERYDLGIDPEARIRDLSVAAKQKVEILKALARDARLLILDEPTAVLSPPEIEELFNRLRQLRDEGTTLLFISHKIGEVLALADHVTALRSGRIEGGGSAAALSSDALARLVMGRDVAPAVRTACRPGEVLVSLRDVVLASTDAADRLDGMSLHLRKGEIVGIAGVDGNGQRGLAAVLTGARRPDAGVVIFDGADMTGATTARWRSAGLAHLPADRFEAGGAPALSIRDNAIAGSDGDITLHAGPFLRPRAIRNRARTLLDHLAVRHGGLSQPLSSLSGGNAQKLIAARELQGNPRFILADQPTRGIDIASASALHQLLDDAAGRGAAVLIISADLDELLRVCDRIAVLHSGRIVADFPCGTDLDVGQLGRAMLGMRETA